VRARFGGLPYLLKLLAAARPLSVQVHPARAQAEAGYAREERDGPPRDDAARCYRDPRAKPELLVALGPFDALAGLRPPAQVAAALARVPALAALLPDPDADPQGLRRLVEAWFALPAARRAPALDALAAHLRARADAEPPDAVARALRAHAAARPPDPGLLFALLLVPVHLEAGEALFLPPGTPHAYLGGAAVELMACSDNTLRAGLTSKHVDVGELLHAVHFDAPAPTVLAAPDATGTWRVPAAEFALQRLSPAPQAPVERRAAGPETLLVLPGSASVHVGFAGGGLDLGAGEACLVPDGVAYRLEAAGEATVLRAHVPVPGADAPAGPAATAGRVEVLRRSIAAADALFRTGTPAGVVGVVSGSPGARAHWEQVLEGARASLRARRVLSLHEDRPVNQAFGLLLLWQRLRPHLRPGEGALVTFVFGEGTRVSPWTEAEGGQKASLRTFVRAAPARARATLGTGELALRHFATVESHLRRSGFDGVVVKWGDEVLVAGRDLSGADPRLAGADVVRFVARRPLTAASAQHKDWIALDADGRVTRFVPRRPLAAMQALAAEGCFEERDGALHGWVNLGSVALSRPLLDVLLEAFEAEVADVGADRRRRPDLDPQLFTALTVAALPDEERRAAAWARACRESEAVRALRRNLPDVLQRLRAALERFEKRQGRAPVLRALDLGRPYWGDAGQHRSLFDLFAALRQAGEAGVVARALAGLGEPDAEGNVRAGDTRLGPGVRVRGSVLIDAHVQDGCVEDSVLVGTRCGTLDARGALDVESVAADLRLEPRAGSYRLLAAEPVALGPGERVTTVVFPEGAVDLRVHEDTDLRDRAASYDVPILGNPLSFREAHARAAAADPAALEDRRASLRAALRLPPQGRAAP
jgi:mannose-6-phosphate isomerase class I